MQINIEVFCWFVTRHAQSAQNEKFPYVSNISRNALGVKLIFCLQINAKVFYKLIVSLYVCVARHAQNTQNNNFKISLQYIEESMKDEVDFCRLLQTDFIILGVHDQACQN